jgi:hypothetical protein
MKVGRAVLGRSTPHFINLSEKGQDRRSATGHAVFFMILRCCSAVFASRSSLHRLDVIPIDSAGIKEKAN